MSNYYDDDSFIDFEDIYSDRKRKNAKRASRRRGASNRRGSSRRSSRVNWKRIRNRAAIIAVLLLAVLVPIIGVSAIMSTSNVGNVPSVTVTEVTDTDAVVSWQPVKDAEGYRVFLRTADEEDYREYQTLTGAEALTATVSGLEQLTEYRFAVTALDKDSESKKKTESAPTRTLLTPPEITNLFSSEKGTIHVSWKRNDKAAGYRVAYKAEGGAYDDEHTLTISDPATVNADISPLEIGMKYDVCVTAFADGETAAESRPGAERSAQVIGDLTNVIPKAQSPAVDPSIDPDKPMVALTFDDGPLDDGSSERILDVLEQYGAKATFFMVGNNIPGREDNVRRKAALGMELGNHTWSHKHYGDDVLPDDIRLASNEVFRVTGQYSTAFRSPGGITTDAILRECATENMSAYYWSIDTEDWNSRNADEIYHAVLDYVEDGDIILMHEIYDTTAEAVERMVPELIEQGYQLVTCHDLIACKTGEEPVPGVQYYKGFSQ